MSYTIIITSAEEKRTKSRPQYGRIKVEYISAAEYSELSHADRKEYRQLENGEYMREVFGYPEPTEEVTEKDVKIFEQTVDTIKLAEIVAVINGITSK